MAPKVPPDKILYQFYHSLLQSQCHVSWSLFSKQTQNQFAQWFLEELQRRNPNAVNAAQLGVKEVKIMFGNNDSMVMKFFWRRFFFSSGANEFARFGYFSTDEIQGNQAFVRATVRLPNGQVREFRLPMVNEKGWKYAYVENNLPF